MKTTIISSEKLNKFTELMKSKQQSRLIQGIYTNQGVLTHNASGMFACNNIPDSALRSNIKLAKIKLKLICKPQNILNAHTASHKWFLVDRV